MHVLIAQETRFKDTYTIPIGNWLLISSGVHDKNTKTGVAIYLNPTVKGAVINYLTVSDRIISTTFMTKAGPMVIINHHAPDETKSLEIKTAHWDLLGCLLYTSDAADE